MLSKGTSLGSIASIALNRYALPRTAMPRLALGYSFLIRVRNLLPAMQQSQVRLHLLLFGHAHEVLVVTQLAKFIQRRDELAIALVFGYQLLDPGILPMS